jgi:type VI secretion system secreted protein Hcp
MAAVDYFLKLDGIDGESQDGKHKNEIDIDAWHWEAKNAGTSASGGGGGAGKVHMHDIHFTMGVNKSSPKLMLACASGQHIKSALLTCRKAGTTQQEHYVIKLSDVLVTSYRTGGAKTGFVEEGGTELTLAQATVPIDQFSLNFSKIEMGYKEQKSDGSSSGEIKAGWDVKANQKI